jgi:hypothetical protein
MATIDDALIIRDILDTNWNSGNVAKPVFYYTDAIKTHDYRRDAIKVYVRSGPLRNPMGIGYNTESVSTGISVDIRCSNRDRMLALRDEANRVLMSVRKNPDSNYDLLLCSSERQITGYANFWHYVIEITLKNNMRTIVT